MESLFKWDKNSNNLIYEYYKYFCHLRYNIFNKILIN